MIKEIVDFFSFMNTLLDAIPELIPVYNEHLDDYDEVLEHVFMGDVTRFAEQLYVENPESECLIKLFEFFDKAYSSGDAKVKELIAVSVLENLSRDKGYYKGIRALLSPCLEDELSRYD